MSKALIERAKCKGSDALTSFIQIASIWLSPLNIAVCYGNEVLKSAPWKICGVLFEESPVGVSALSILVCLETTTEIISCLLVFGKLY